MHHKRISLLDVSLIYGLLLLILDEQTDLLAAFLQPNLHVYPFLLCFLANFAASRQSLQQTLCFINIIRGIFGTAGDNEVVNLPLLNIACHCAHAHIPKSMLKR